MRKELVHTPTGTDRMKRKKTTLRERLELHVKAAAGCSTGTGTFPGSLEEARLSQFAQPPPNKGRASS